MPTPLSDLGEFALIERLTEHHKTQQASTLLGVGDDAAVLAPSGDRVRLITTDLLLEGVHFDLTYVALTHLGYKSVAVNLSDICAMNGRPEQITVSLGISSKFSVEQIDELYEGIYTACAHYGVDLIGGDTSASLNGLVISITCIGSAAPDQVVYRSGAKAGDLICTTGNLGAAYMGLLLLEREKRVFEATKDPDFTPDFVGREYLIERQLKPEPRLDIINAMAAAGIKPSAMMDISDGLSSELLHISKHSKVGIRLYEDKLPIDYQTHAMAEELQIAPVTAALNGGEDYELVATFPLEYLERIRSIADLHIVGHCTEPEEGNHLVARDGSLIPLESQGWKAPFNLKNPSNS